jgi:hypothetical protein
MLLACFSANSDRPPIGFCILFLIGSKYGILMGNEVNIQKKGKVVWELSEDVSL